MYYFTDRITTDIMMAGSEIRHTYLGAFNPSQNICDWVEGTLEEVMIKAPKVCVTNFMNLKSSVQK